MPRYRVVHNNLYSFHETVSHCSLEARLKPVDNEKQTVEFSQFVVRPLASAQRIAQDDFGNHVSHFEINRSLQSFKLSAIHTVSTLPSVAIDLTSSSPWQHVVDRVAQDASFETRYLNAIDSSSYITFNQDLAAYAGVSFLPGRPLLDAAFNLMQRIYEDFQYDPLATKVDTTAIEAFALKRGVCQDFSHIAIACLRSLNLPVRYVSGYVDTKIASGNPRRYGGDVSHAWFSVYDPDYGWVDFDPTNNNMPGETYITVAYGCDYHDVAPLIGQVDVHGQSKLKVSVDMTEIKGAD
jgi:transglutaminase-like putative cysteine protease